MGGDPRTGRELWLSQTLKTTRDRICLGEMVGFNLEKTLG
jgi:hypothetical protein